MNDCIDTVEAVRRLTSDIADHEISRGDKDMPVSVLVYRKRELAIELLYGAFCDCELATWVRSATGGLIQLLGTEWRAAAFWRDITIGGLVRASAGEPWLRHEGEAVLLEAGAFQTWREWRKQPAKAPDRTRKGTMSSKRADDAIREALMRVCKDAIAAGKKVPNSDQAYSIVRPLVSELGFEVSRDDVRLIASEAKFAAMRLKRGQRHK
jgi:hypothetical protein